MVRARQFVLITKSFVRVFGRRPDSRISTHIVLLVCYGFVTGWIVSVDLVKSDPTNS
jgi:hypothetical protein